MFQQQQQQMMILQQQPLLHPVNCNVNQKLPDCATTGCSASSLIHVGFEYILQFQNSALPAD